MSINWKPLYEAVDRCEALARELRHNAGYPFVTSRAGVILDSLEVIMAALHVARKDLDAPELPNIPQVARSRAADPETSKAAARSLDPGKISKTQLQVLRCMFLEQTGQNEPIPFSLTDEDIIRAVAFHYGPNLVSNSGVRTRRKELCRGGLVEVARDKDNKPILQTLRSGRYGRTYNVTVNGMDVLIKAHMNRAE